MIRALLVIWAMDPSGATTAAVQPLPSMGVCQSIAAKGPRRMCLPEAQVDTLMRSLRELDCQPVDATRYVCPAKASP